MDMPTPKLAHNVTRLGHYALPGAGQVYVDGNYCYVGHITNKAGLGTSIVDVADPKNPKVICQLPVGDNTSHSHKARAVGDIMITNMEQNMTAIGRKADELPKLRTVMKAELGREATDAELAAKLGVAAADIPEVDALAKRPYAEGGFKVWDIKDRKNPKLLTHVRTHGRGVHRFDMDANYAYISTEMEGFIGNILVIYDLADPKQPEEVSRWWMPGQHLAGGEQPSWVGRRNRLHHALRFGNRLLMMHAGRVALDVAGEDRHQAQDFFGRAFPVLGRKGKQGQHRNAEFAGSANDPPHGVRAAPMAATSPSPSRAASPRPKAKRS